MKRRIYVGDLPESFLSSDWISMWNIKDDFIFVNKNNFAIVKNASKCKNIVSVLQNKKIEKYFVRNHLNIFTENFGGKIKNAYCLEILSSVCRTYCKKHDFESITLEFSKCHLKPVLNMDRVSNAVVHMKNCYENLKSICIQEERWHIIIEIQKALENINTVWAMRLISMIEY